ncbi:MAG: NADH-dependent dehydrogenase [Paenibacillus sp.]|nr:NADH-dependent dehydrogenase [Paenibacillus sp.]
MEKIRIGIIGCGGMAGSHFKGYEALLDQMKVTAVCDIVPERAQKAAEQLGITKAVTDYHDLLDDVDAVLIVLPHDLHYEVGIACLKAGKHVLMEKPIANSEAEVLDLIKTSEEVGKILMTAYPVRFWPFLSAHRLGGGQFFSHGCHYIDIMMWILGRPLWGTHMGTNRGTPWMEKEGTSNVSLEFESGALGYHFGTWGARGTRLGYSIHAHCTKGMLEAHISGGKLYAHTEMVREKSNLDTSSTTEVLLEVPLDGKNTHYEIQHFLDCIRSGSVPLTDGPSSLQGLRVIWRLYEAEKNHVVADLSGLGLEDDWKAVIPGIS